jgi:hypothetical protein
VRGVRSINIVFPPENAELYERSASNGAVITQFPFDRPGDKQSFPIRNRLVAGMTLGTVVVEGQSHQRRFDYSQLRQRIRPSSLRGSRSD